MIHICKTCSFERECGYYCGSPVEETCTHCNNVVVLKEAKQRCIPIKDLGMDPLGGYHIK